jgi:hypothetical protein
VGGSDFEGILGRHADEIRERWRRAAATPRLVTVPEAALANLVLVAGKVLGVATADGDDGGLGDEVAEAVDRVYGRGQ